jgi:hypothetical protein
VEVNGLLQTLLTLRSGKQQPVLIRQEAGWARKAVWMLWIKEKSISPAWNQTPIPWSTSQWLCYYYD